MRKGLAGFIGLCLAILFSIQIAFVEKSEAQGLCEYGFAPIAGGYYHTLAPKGNWCVNTVWGWGYNGFGQLGYGTTGGDRASPVQVVGPGGIDFLSDVEAVSAGYHNLALKWDGTVWAWGKNDYGQIGDGTSGINRTSPVQVMESIVDPVPLTGVTAVAAGENHSLALLGDGTVRAWGYNLYGQLGNDNHPSNVTLPDIVHGAAFFSPGVTAIAAGSDHSLALISSGTVESVGRNDHGQLGLASSDLDAHDLSFSVLAGESTNGPYLSDIVSVAAGRSHSVALKSDGTVLAWGDGTYGQVGWGSFSSIPNTTPRFVMIKPPELPLIPFTGAARIAAGCWHTVALKDDGTVWAWGRNNFGQLGNGHAGVSVCVTVIPYIGAPFRVCGIPGETANQMTPVQVKMLDGGVETPFGGVVAIAAGCEHTVARRFDGSVWVWGNGEYGQVGNGQHFPVHVKNPLDQFRVQVVYPFQVFPPLLDVVYTPVTTFDDLPDPGAGGVASIPSGYKGLNWGMNYADAAVMDTIYGSPLFRDGVVTSPYVAFNSGVGSTTISRGGGGLFNFYGASIASNGSSTLHITGRNGGGAGTIVCEQWVSFSGFEAKWVDANCTGIDSLNLHNYVGPTNEPVPFIMDNFNGRCEGLGGDTDGDGVCDFVDNCPDYPNPNQNDIDRDGIGDLCDNCKMHSNPGQEDNGIPTSTPPFAGVGNGIGDACDPLTTPSGTSGTAVLIDPGAVKPADAPNFVHACFTFEPPILPASVCSGQQPQLFPPDLGNTVLEVTKADGTVIESPICILVTSYNIPFGLANLNVGQQYCTDIDLSKYFPAEVLGLDPGEVIYINVKAIYTNTIQSDVPNSCPSIWEGTVITDTVQVPVGNAVKVPIDIKPGTPSPKSINLGSNGTIPVAILTIPPDGYIPPAQGGNQACTNPKFDATQVDPCSVMLEHSKVKIKGKGTPISSVTDVNGDGCPDMLVHVNTVGLDLTPAATKAVLTGNLKMGPGTCPDGPDPNLKGSDIGSFFAGSNDIKVVP